MDTVFDRMKDKSTSKKYDGIGKFNINVERSIPDHVSLFFDTNGHQGGDGGHGGFALLGLSTTSPSIKVVGIENGKRKEIMTDMVSVKVSGDWEITGFALGLLELGLQLLNNDDVLLEYVNKRKNFK